MSVLLLLLWLLLLLSSLVIRVMEKWGPFWFSKEGAPGINTETSHLTVLSSSDLLMVPALGWIQSEAIGELTDQPPQTHRQVEKDWQESTGATRRCLTHTHTHTHTIWFLLSQTPKLPQSSKATSFIGTTTSFWGLTMCQVHF